MLIGKNKLVDLLKIFDIITSQNVKKKYYPDRSGRTTIKSP